MDRNIQDTLQKLNALGVDIRASEYGTVLQSGNEPVGGCAFESSQEDVETYITAVKTFINSMDFMRLGQAINHKQWQAAAMKAQKMSAEAKRLGITRFERPFTGIRQNINHKNSKEALQALSMIIAVRVKIIEVLGIK